MYRIVDRKLPVHVRAALPAQGGHPHGEYVTDGDLAVRRRGESGQVLPLIAICLTVIMGFAGMSVDVGYLEYHQRQQQSAADAAALGAAQQLVYSGCPNLSAAQTAADSDSASNGFTTGTNNVTVLVNNPPATGPYAGNSCAVSIQVQASKTATFFTRLFGLNGAETTQAVGLLTANNTPPPVSLRRAPPFRRPSMARR